MCAGWVLALTVLLGFLVAGSILFKFLSSSDLTLPESAQTHATVEDEIAKLKARLDTLEQSGTSNSWTKILLLWQTRRRLKELQLRHAKSEQQARHQCERAQGICTPESLPRPSSDIQTPPSRKGDRL